MADSVVASAAEIDGTPRIDPADEFLYAVGDSHVRTFAGCSRFLPLFIGAGKRACYVTDDCRARTRGLLEGVLPRLDRSKAVVFVFGEPDVRLHDEDAFSTKTVGDAMQMAASARRYYDTVVAMRERFGVKPLIMAATHAMQQERAKLSLLYNTVLKALCLEGRIPFIDVNPKVTDGRTGALYGAYTTDGIHLNQTVISEIIPELQRHGYLRQVRATGPDFTFRCRHSLRLEQRGEVRIWGDVVLSERTAAVKRTEAVDALLATLGDAEPGRVVVFGGGEGCLALRLALRPPLCANGRAERIIVSLDESASHVTMARRLLALTGVKNVAMQGGFVPDKGVLSGSDTVVAFVDDMSVEAQEAFAALVESGAPARVYLVQCDAGSEPLVRRLDPPQVRQQVSCAARMSVKQ